MKEVKSRREQKGRTTLSKISSEFLKANTLKRGRKAYT
jgi:hypothetical protein